MHLWKEYLVTDKEAFMLTSKGKKRRESIIKTKMEGGTREKYAYSE